MVFGGAELEGEEEGLWRNSMGAPQKRPKKAGGRLIWMVENLGGGGGDVKKSHHGSGDDIHGK